MTIDGCCDHTKGTGHDEVLDYHIQLLKDVDLLIFGRKTYQLMVPFWPDALNNPEMTRKEHEFATAFVSKDKLVFSTTLKEGENNARLVRTNPVDEILKLKQQAGKDMLIGGVSLPSQLIVADLIDEYHFLIQPTLNGDGTRILGGITLEEQLRLKLAEAKVLESGDVVLRYVKR